MSISIPEFWQLAVESGLLSPDQSQQLRIAFGQVRGASVQSNARTLAEWLISRNILTRYQTNILLAGHPGPFQYGAYTICDRVESGPFAGMFRALHGPTNHPVLLRFLTGESVQDSRRWAALADAWRAHCRVRQANLQRCFELVDLEAYKFLVLEDLAGRPLETAWQSGKRLAPSEASRIARSAALGLDALHRQGLAHGDVRPARIWLEQGGHVKLLRDPPADHAPIDFLQPDPEGRLLARAEYLAPDFLQPEQAPDGLTDLYSLGCVYYHLLTGQPPFPGGDIRQKMVRHASQPLPALESAGIPRAIAAAVTSLTAKDRAARCSQASRLVAQLTAQVEPARLNIAPPSPPPTLAVYESMLQQARPAAAIPAPAPGAAGAGAARTAAPPVSPPAVPVAAPAAIRAPAAGAAVPLAKVTAAPVVPGGSQPPAASLRSRRARPRKQNLPLMVGIGLGSAALLILVGLMVLSSLGGNSASRPEPVEQVEEGTGDATSPPDEATPAPDPGPTTPVAAAGGPFATIADDGQTPWLGPTTGSPISLRYVPPGSQFYLVARPAELLARSEGARVFEALGPAFASARAAWEAASGFSLSEVQQLILTLHEAGPEFPRANVVVRLAQPIDRAGLLQRWGAPAAATVGNVEYYRAASGWTFYAPADGNDQVFVMGPEEQIREVIEGGGAPPVMRLAMNKLLAVSDDGRQVTVLFSPNELISNLFRDGRRLSLCEPQKIREPLDWFLGDGIEAGLVSAHLDEYAYAELLLVGRAGQAKDALTQQLRGRLQEMPERVERYVASLDPSPYWRMVAFRYPQMIRYLHGKTRIGVEGEVAVINAALPAEAVHNLVFATEMALASTPGPATGTGTSPPSTAAPRDLADLLNHRFTIRFAQDSLEFSMQNVASEVRDTFPNLAFPFDIRILGGDLEKNGITRNQQIREFDQPERTLAEILTAMVVKANPKTTSDAKDPTQQLIWVIGPDPETPSRNIVLITTRDAAAERNYDVPAVFRAD